MLDAIIVGQGLAGSILALQLIKQGRSVKIIDNQSSRCSIIAAGIVNPITGRKYVKSWEYDMLSDFAYTFYNKWEKTFKNDFYTELKIGKVINAVKDKNEFLLKIQDEPFSLLNSINNVPEHIKYDKDNIYIINGFRLNTSKFLNSCKNYFSSIRSLSIKDFDYENISIHNSNIVYKDLKAKHIIFCEGHKIKDNPYFNYLPMRPTKGELLEIETDAHKTNICFQKHHFLLPVSNKSFKVGSNYERENINETPTETIRNDLEEFFTHSSSLKYKIKEHQAGIRPSTIDRRPFIGEHPSHKNLWVFNGFGSKGVSLCPYLSSHLLTHIFEKKALNKEVSIVRYIKYFSKT